jgi:hypothetical protein
MVEEHVNVVFTGQSGLDKRSLISDLKLLAESRGKRVELFSIGEMMYRTLDVPKRRILKLPLGRLELTRSQAFQEVQHYMTQNPEDNVYIDTHATFRWEDGLFSGFAPQEITELAPDLCICFVADVDQVKAGLAYSDYPLKLTLRDIMTWREEEMLGSGLIAAIVGCSHYVVPRQLHSDALYRLIHEPEAKKLYISFPISRIPAGSMRADIDEFRNEFRKLTSCVVFDPLEVTEEPRLLAALKKTLSNDQDAKTVKVESRGQEVHLGVHELQEIKGYIKGRTRSFDYRMIEQSDAIVAFIPEQKGQPYVAEGVLMEIAYAEYRAKEIFLIWPSAEDPSLMIKADRTFSSLQEAAGFFRHQGQS